VQAFNLDASNQRRGGKNAGVDDDNDEDDDIDPDELLGM